MLPRYSILYTRQPTCCILYTTLPRYHILYTRLPKYRILYSMLPRYCIFYTTHIPYFIHYSNYIQLFNRLYCLQSAFCTLHQSVVSTFHIFQTIWPTYCFIPDYTTYTPHFQNIYRLYIHCLAFSRLNYPHMFFRQC